MFTKSLWRTCKTRWLLNRCARFDEAGSSSSLVLGSSLERIILANSNEGDTVLDPFCGSATTGVVAIKHNRKFVGIDLEKEYIDKFAIPRIKDELLQK